MRLGQLNWKQWEKGFYLDSVWRACRTLSRKSINTLAMSTYKPRACFPCSECSGQAGPVEQPLGITHPRQSCPKSFREQCIMQQAGAAPRCPTEGYSPFAGSM